MTQWELVDMILGQVHPSHPKIVSEMANVTVSEGDNVTLACRVVSTHTPTIQWFKHLLNGTQEVTLVRKDS
jgi:plastocyanin